MSVGSGMDGIQDDFEAHLYEEVLGELQRQHSEIIKAGLIISAGFWAQAEERLALAMIDPLAQAYEASALASMQGAGITAVDITAGMSEQIGAATFARGYAFDKVKSITATSRRDISRIITDGIENQLSLDEMASLIDKATTFGPVRARMIAVTETTRAWMEGAKAVQGYLKNVGIFTKLVWQTVADDLVDRICLERDGREQGDGWDEPEPAHVNCRCFVAVVPI